MAKSKNNVVTHGLSGLIGDLLVFRQRNGETIVANKPKASTGPLTPEQEEARKRFKRAVGYGKAVVADPVKSLLYKGGTKKGNTVYITAVTDYLTSPQLDDANITEYTGLIGQQIRVNALDDFMVAGVQVQILNADATVLEEGSAVQLEGSLEWKYTTTKKNLSMAGSKIKFTASDLPGNKSELEITLS